MNSFLIERQQVNCNCFQTNLKLPHRIFRTDSNHQIKALNSQIKQLSARNLSEQTKHKKKSLKKDNHTFTHASEKNIKPKEEIHNFIDTPDIQSSFNHVSLKKQQNTAPFDNSQFLNHMPVQLQRLKQTYKPRTQYNQFSYQPIYQLKRQTKEKVKSRDIFSEKMIIDKEYDKKISQEFQKDLLQFKLAMEKKSSQQNQLKQVSNIKKQSESHHKLSNSNRNGKIQQYLVLPLFHNFVSLNLTPTGKNQRQQQKIVTYRSNDARNSLKISIKKDKTKILPKEIESQRDPNSQTDSDQLSQVIGHGWNDGQNICTEFSEIDKKRRADTDTMRMQTMATHSSQAQIIPIRTSAEFSSFFNSPEGLNNIKIGSEGLQIQKLSGTSYKPIKQVKSTKHSKVYES